MTKFRPCIDLHAGSVKQIVGGTLKNDTDAPTTNYTSELPAGHYAKLYRDRNLVGSHVIMLGPGNTDAAREACAAWPGGLQVGGGINASNAKQWIEWGASKVIVTSALFPNKEFSLDKLKEILAALDNDTSRLVIDLSCRRVNVDKQGERIASTTAATSATTTTATTPKWFVAMDKWQTITSLEITAETLQMLAPYCCEFLIHAADNEGLQRGIDRELVEALARWNVGVPITYAGGAWSLEDLELVQRLSDGKIDLTIGSALDVFGGSGVKFDDCVAWNNARP